MSHCLLEFELMNGDDAFMELKPSVVGMLWKVSGMYIPQLHPKLVEQMGLQVRRKIWVLFLLAQGGAEHPQIGFGQQNLSERPRKAPIVPGTAQQRCLYGKLQSPVSVGLVTS